MSSGAPVVDHYYHPPQQQKQVIVYDTGAEISDDDSYEEVNAHAVGLEDVTAGTVINTVPVRICRSLSELQENEKMRRVYLTKEQIAQLKLPNTAFDKNGVALDERVGDPCKTVFKSVEIRSLKNGHAIPFVAEIVGLQNRVPTKSGKAATVYMSSKANQPDCHIDISQPNSVVTERMLAFHQPMQAVKRQIHPSADPMDPHWGLTVWDHDGSKTFAASVLADMCDQGVFSKLKSQALFADTSQSKIDLPKEILQRVRSEIEAAQTKVENGFINMNEWYVEFRPFDSKDYLSKDVNSATRRIAGQYVGSNVEKTSRHIQESGNIRQELELVLDIEMAMMNVE